MTFFVDVTCESKAHPYKWTEEHRKMYKQWYKNCGQGWQERLESFEEARKFWSF